VIEFSISSSLFWNKFNPLFITIFAVKSFHKFCKSCELDFNWCAYSTHTFLLSSCLDREREVCLIVLSVYLFHSKYKMVCFTSWWLHLIRFCFIENWCSRMTPFFFVCGVAVFRWIWIPRDIVWADISMLPCFIYWKGWIFFSLPFAAISVHWYDFELVSKRMAVSVCLLIDIFLICGLWGFKFYGNYLLIGERHFFFVLQMIK